MAGDGLACWIVIADGVIADETNARPARLPVALCDGGRVVGYAGVTLA